MQIDVVDANNEKVGAIDLRDDVFGGQVKSALVWESVVRANAAERRGTHATKNRALVSGSGKKPWRQKGTGRARVGDIRTPLWRKGGTVFGPQPRSYDFHVPAKVERGALRAALIEKLRDGQITVVETLTLAEAKTKAAAALLKRLDVGAKVVMIDVTADGNLARAVRNIPDVSLVLAGRVTARDVVGARRVVTTKSALERLQEALGA